MKAFVFPGQGTQFVGMFREEHATIPAAVRSLLDLGCQILGYNIKRVMFEGPTEELNRTAISQPAIFLHSCCLLHQISEKPDVVAGHSLGEYTALFAAGALEFADALMLVQARAKAMQRASEGVQGAMAAIIGLDEVTLNDICIEVRQEVGGVWIANLNSPGQIVVSGLSGAVDEAMSRARVAGARLTKKLAVTAASHTPLMEPAIIDLERALTATSMRDTTIPIYMNVDTRPHTRPIDIKAALLRQLTHPVKWVETIRNMEAGGVNEFVEIGPGNILQGLIKRITPTAAISGVDTNKAPRD